MSALHDSGEEDIVVLECNDLAEDQVGHSLDSDEDDENVAVEVESHAWACRYCGIADPASVVRCIKSDSWFCNSRGGTTASHVVQHLVRSRNNEICLHPESPLGETLVECYNCATRNVFMMGFIPAKGEAVVVLLCRNCLTLGGTLKDLGWNMDLWTPLIQDRQIVPWLVKVPTEREQLRARQVTTAQIGKLEELWRTNPNAKLEDLEAPGLDDEPPQVQLRYEDGYQYQSVFKPLVQLEADYDRDMTERLSAENVAVIWSPSVANSRVSVSMSQVHLGTLQPSIGDEVKLTISKHLCMRSRDWQASGTVIHVDDDGYIHVELRSKGPKPPFEVTEGYHVCMVWKPITFDRMQSAMNSMVSYGSAMSEYLYHKLLGHDIEDQVWKSQLPTTFNAPGLPALNSSQVDAISKVMQRPLSLIQGPPGTGKTVTSASLVYHLVQQNPGTQILVCAPSNVAVDQLTEKISATGVRVVRLAAKSREHLESTVEHLSLHTMVQTLDGKASDELRTLMTKRDAGGSLAQRDAIRLQKLRKQIERTVLQSAEVVCCTCVGAGDPRLRSLKFRTLLLDEATQATEPESLIPVVLGSKQFILVGDHRQLGPVVVNPKAAAAGLSTSLFERLVTLGLPPIRLKVQYRMHPCLSEFSSNCFYDGSLANGVSTVQRTHVGIDFPWIDKAKPMMFWSCTGPEELAGTGTTYLNQTEASNCEKIVTALLRAGVKPENIGVITPYEGQRAHVTQLLQRQGRIEVYREVEVSSVDAFQGREKDYIIVSCVRSNEKQGIGFLRDPRRLNVALTRAKYGLVVLGNPHVLSKQRLWNALLWHFKEQHLLVEGALNNLKVSNPALRFRAQYNAKNVFEENCEKVFSGDPLNPFGVTTTRVEWSSVFDPRISEVCESESFS